MTDPPLAKRGKTSTTTTTAAAAVDTTTGAGANDDEDEPVDFSLLAAANCLPSLSLASTAELSSFSSFSTAATSSSTSSPPPPTCVASFGNHSSATTTTTTTTTPLDDRVHYNNKNHQNPAQFLPAEVLCRITGFLDVRSLVQLGMTNQYYRHLCRLNQAGWENLCWTTWQTKVFVCEKARQLLLRQQEQDNDEENNNNNNNTTALEAFQMAWRDARERHYILPSEFVFDAETGQGTIWSFRFKESAGADWTSVDPWYQGLPCRQMVFLPNGTVQQYLSPRANMEQDVWNRPLSVHQPPPAAAAAAQNGHPRLAQATRLADGACLVDPPVPMSWRFLTRPMDFKTRPWGSYVRFTVAGRDVPTYIVQRSPTQNWGFVLESCWGLYTSFALPPRRQRLLRRTFEGTTTWVEEGEEEEEMIGTTSATSSTSTASSSSSSSSIRGMEDMQDDVDAGFGLDDPAINQHEDLQLVFSSNELAETNNGTILTTGTSSDNAPGDDTLEEDRHREMLDDHDDVLMHDHHVMDAAPEQEPVQQQPDPDPAAATRRQGTRRSRRRIQQQLGPKRQRTTTTTSSENRNHLLADDSCLLITNELQWREAFLYNVGAGVLPEGEEAVAQFDQAWAVV